MNSLACTRAPRRRGSTAASAPPRGAWVLHPRRSRNRRSAIERQHGISYIRAMTDRELLDDLIGKLREMEEQLAMAQLESAAQTLLASRIRHLALLALYIRSGLQRMKDSVDRPPAGVEPENRRDA